MPIKFLVLGVFFECGGGGGLEVPAVMGVGIFLILIALTETMM